MKINEQVHMIRKEFYVTPEVKRYVNIYLIVGRHCYIVDRPLTDGEEIILEEGIKIRTLSTPGHSHGSMSYILNDEFIFTGDAVPLINDLPIFVDYNETVKSLDKIQGLSQIQYYCPAWDEVRKKEDFAAILEDSRAMLLKLKSAVLQVENESPAISDAEKTNEILKRSDMLMYAGNPLVIKSIEACKNACG